MPRSSPLDPLPAPKGLFVTGTDTDVGKTYIASLIARQLVDEGKRVGVYKPVASGCRLAEEIPLPPRGKGLGEGALLVPAPPPPLTPPPKEGGESVSDDAVALWEAAGRPLTLDRVCPQRFKAPVAPHRAAAAEQKKVDPALLRSGIEPWVADAEEGGGFDFVIVEGAGGLLSPISDEDYVADVAIDLHTRFGWPLLVVAPNKLGTINATLQTIITANAYRSGLPVAGVVLNQVAPIDPDQAVSGNYDASIASNHLDIARSSPAPLLADVRFGKGFGDQIDWFAIAAPA